MRDGRPRVSADTHPRRNASLPWLHFRLSSVSFAIRSSVIWPFLYRFRENFGTFYSRLRIAAPCISYCGADSCTSMAVKLPNPLGNFFPNVAKRFQNFERCPRARNAFAELTDFVDAHVAE